MSEKGECGRRGGGGGSGAVEGKRDGNYLMYQHENHNVLRYIENTG